MVVRAVRIEGRRQQLGFGKAAEVAEVGGAGADQFEQFLTMLERPPGDGCTWMGMRSGRRNSTACITRSRLPKASSRAAPRVTDATLHRIITPEVLHLFRDPFPLQPRKAVGAGLRSAPMIRPQTGKAKRIFPATVAA